MKKLFFIVGLLSLLTFFSCQNEENVYYSCDEAEDAWVKENLSSIRKMETTEWFSISVFRISKQPKITRNIQA